MGYSGGSSESEGARMGAGAFAGMPSEVKMQAYPKSKSYRGNVLNDTISGIDSVTKVSEGKAQKNISNQH